IAFDEHFQGGIASTNVHSVEVVRRALIYQAAAVILAHNHPSGVTDPSAADKAITERLVSALQLVDVRVLDHFVIGDGLAYSFAEHGLL
ncbi:MAG: JAB domain-containing protein, partial [Gammaproteobacteria bacterium]